MDIIKIIRSLYEDAKEKYKNSPKPNNYIPGYIKKKFKEIYNKDILNEEIHKIIFQDNKDIFCPICKQKIPYKTFGRILKFCNKKCSCIHHKTDEYKKLQSEKLKGKPNPNKGKTYLEIYGTTNPKCGFKKGEANIAKKPEIRKKISEGVKKSYTPELRLKRSIQARNNLKFLTGGGYKSRKTSDNYGNYFRSSLEAEFSNFLIENNINYEYEKIVNMINGRKKIVDFVIDNDILIEVSDYVFDDWQKTFNEKMKLLRNTFDPSEKILILITYKDKETLLFKNISKQRTGESIFIHSIDNKEKILECINFSKWILKTNKELKNV